MPPASTHTHAGPPSLRGRHDSSNHTQTNATLREKLYNDIMRNAKDLCTVACDGNV
jgi:hypothetical protein